MQRVGPTVVSTMKSLAIILGSVAVGFALGRGNTPAFLGVVAAGLAGCLWTFGIMVTHLLVSLRERAPEELPRAAPTLVVKFGQTSAALF